MKKQQKGGTADLRNKLKNDMVSNIEKLCNKEGYSPHKTLINKYVEAAIDDYILDWYEVSLEAMDLMEGGADFVTDEEIDDPELIIEAKRRVVKNMYEEKPPGLYEHIVASIIHSINSDPQETDIHFEEPGSEVSLESREAGNKALEAQSQVQEPESVKTPANKKNKKKS
jgi:hypothetical protein